MSDTVALPNVIVDKALDDLLRAEVSESGQSIASLVRIAVARELVRVGRIKSLNEIPILHPRQGKRKEPLELA